MWTIAASNTKFLALAINFLYKQKAVFRLTKFMHLCRFMHKKSKPRFFQRLGMLKNATFFSVLLTKGALHNGTLSLYF